MKKDGKKDILDIQNKYVKLDPIDHVLRRPNMYVGSIEEDEYKTWSFDEKSQKMIKKNLKYVPGFYKIYDELIVNILDHMKRIEMDKNEDKYEVKNIKISIDLDENKIEVYNDGDGIDIEIHPEHKVYIPELIFGNTKYGYSIDIWSAGCVIAELING